MSLGYAIAEQVEFQWHFQRHVEIRGKCSLSRGASVSRGVSRAHVFLLSRGITLGTTVTSQEMIESRYSDTFSQADIVICDITVRKLPGSVVLWDVIVPKAVLCRIAWTKGVVFAYAVCDNTIRRVLLLRSRLFEHIGSVCRWKEEGLVQQSRRLIWTMIFDDCSVS